MPPRSTPAGYTQKFERFITMCAALNPGDEVLIHHPHVLGDTYEEIIESLNRIADAALRLHILPTGERGA